jgi:peptide/nickel transport system substrate-binding protein
MKRQDFGFGAYHVAEFVPGSHVKFVTNPYYWKGEPFFKEVLLREVPESSNRLAIMISGEAHLTDELTLVQKAELLEGKGEARYVGLPEASFHFWVYLNRSTGAFTNKQCFQAVGYAVPYEEVQRVPYFGFGKIMREAVVPMYGETVNVGNSPYKYDPDKAKELWKAGNCPSSWTLTFDQEHPEWEDVGILIRTEFAKFGVDVKLDKQPENIISSKSSKRELEAFFEESAAFVADAGYAAWLNWHKDSFANLQAWYDEDNKTVSAQIDQAMAMLPGPERTKLLHEIQDVLLDRGGIMPILVPGWHVAANKHLQGIKWYSTQDIHWFDLYWE